MDQDGDEFSNALQLSALLNKLLQEYYSKTKDINSLLEQDEEESITKIHQILQERETIISKYNIIKEKYEQLRPQDSTTDLELLKQQRSELLGQIRTIESSNLCKSNELFDNYKDKIHDINTGKKAIQAYKKEGPLPDGFFVDKRK